MTIVIAGGSGFIGTMLTKALLAKGESVIVVDIVAPQITHEQLFFIQCDLTTQPLPYNVLERTDALINLVGAPVNKKWTPQYKEVIRTSRVRSTKTLVSALSSAQSRPTVFVNASAVGFYGDTKDGVDERTQKGTGFLADLVADWEAEALMAQQYGVRTVLVRTAPVFGRVGILKAITNTAPFWFLCRVTKKDFWMSWIHERDIVRVYLYALETTTLVGPVNAAAPEQSTYSAIVQEVARLIHRKIVMTIPSWLLKKKFGEFAQEIVSNKRIVPQRLLDKGFVFEYPTIKEALTSIFIKKQ